MTGDEYEHISQIFRTPERLPVYLFPSRDIDTLVRQPNIFGASLSSPFQAYERRFPTCHLIPMFVASDVVDEETSEDGATHRIERRCALDVDAPRLLKRVGFRTVFV